MQNTTRSDTERGSRPPVDLLIGTAGVLDQAVRGLLQLRQGAEYDESPRSPLLDIYQVYRRYSRDTRLVTQLSLLGAAGGTGARILKEWHSVLRMNSSSPTLRRPVHV